VQSDLWIPPGRSLGAHVAAILIRAGPTLCLAAVIAHVLGDPLEDMAPFLPREEFLEDRIAAPKPEAP